VTSNFELSIANLSFLSDTSSFLLQISSKDLPLNDFIKNTVPKNDKTWLSDLKSWEINNIWILQIADLCINAYDQVFFDRGDEILLDLKDDKSFRKFKHIVEESNL